MTPYQEELAERAADQAAREAQRDRLHAGDATMACRVCGQLVVHHVTTSGWATTVPHVAGGRVCVRTQRYSVGRSGDPAGTVP